MLRRSTISYVMTASKHSTTTRCSQLAPASENTTKQQPEEYMDMTENRKEAATSGNTKEQFEEYVEMSDNNKGMCSPEQQLEEYVDVSNGKDQGSNKVQKGSSMYIDLETVQEYEVPVNLRKPSLDSTYL